MPHPLSARRVLDSLHAVSLTNPQLTFRGALSPCAQWGCLDLWPWRRGFLRPELGRPDSWWETAGHHGRKQVPCYHWNRTKDSVFNTEEDTKLIPWCLVTPYPSQRWPTHYTFSECTDLTTPYPNHIAVVMTLYLSRLMGGGALLPNQFLSGPLL